MLLLTMGQSMHFYKDFGNSPGLIKLGRVESGMDILSGMKGDFTATIEKVE